MENNKKITIWEKELVRDGLLAKFKENKTRQVFFIVTKWYPAACQCRAQVFIIDGEFVENITEELAQCLGYGYNKKGVRINSQHQTADRMGEYFFYDTIHFVNVTLWI